MTDLKEHQNEDMKFLATIFLLTLSMTLFSQNVENYQWRKRVVIVYTSDIHSDVYRNQIADLISDMPSWEERKLVLIQVSQNQYKMGTDEDASWQDIEHKDFWARAQKLKDPFTFELIGLDGGSKYVSNHFLPREQLFALIDGMPMRKAELRGKND